MQTSRKTPTADAVKVETAKAAGAAPRSLKSQQMADGEAAARPSLDTAIHFHGLEKSTAIEDKIRDKVAKLKRHFSRMTACRVVLDAPNRGAAKAKMLKVKIEMGVPGRKPLVVEHERPVAHAHEDVNLALRDAFEIATRRIDEVAEKLAARVRQERGRRRPAALPA